MAAAPLPRSFQIRGKTRKCQRGSAFDGSEFQRLERNTLRSHQEFAGEGRFGRAPPQGLFGGELCEIRIVVFLRNMREDEVLRSRIETLWVGQIFTNRVIGKVTRPREHPLLDHPWIRPDL